jgi:hypothetical protein
MMKKLILLLFALSCLSAWSQKPEWLKPHPEGHSVFVQGILVDKADSALALPGSITIINTEEGNQSYTIKANSMGIFQFHLLENGKYVATFEYPDYIVRKIAFDTFNVPDKAWKISAMIDLKVSLDKRPEGFKDVVAMLPVATFQYDSAERLFLFDIEVTDRVLKRYQAELDRARGVTVESSEDAPVQEDTTKD